MVADIVCIGGANWDIKARTTGAFAAGVSNPGVLKTNAGGVARNIAENLARLGLRVALISAVGADARGEDLIAHTAAAGVDVSMIQRVPGETGTYLAILDDKGEMRAAVNAMGAMDTLIVAAILRHQQAIRMAKYVVADCNLPLESLVWLKSLGMKLIIEPVSTMKARKLLQLGLDGLFAVTPNESQAVVLGAEIDKAQNTVIMQGEKGALANGVFIPAMADPARIADVTGAGDAATAGLVFGLARGMAFRDAAILGQAAAAITAESAESVSPEMSADALLSRAR